MKLTKNLVVIASSLSTYINFKKFMCERLLCCNPPPPVCIRSHFDGSLSANVITECPPRKVIKFANWSFQ